MKSLPIFVSLKDKPVLVVGGGDVALRKIQTLLKAQAKVYVVAHEICPAIQLIESDNLLLTIQNYEQSLIADKWLVIAATDDNELNDKVHLDAIAQKTFVNVVDDPKRCQFIFPAIIDRSPIVFAISSGGDAPVFARLWKEKLEAQIPQWAGKLASLAGSYRQQVKHKFQDFKQRRHFWERFFRGDLAALAAQDKWSELEHNLQQAIDNRELVSEQRFVVGYGDGMPENLTLKALQLMQLADVIVYPPNTPEAILDLCRKDADKQLLEPSTEIKDISGIVVQLAASDHSYWQEIK